MLATPAAAATPPAIPRDNTNERPDEQERGIHISHSIRYIASALEYRGSLNAGSSRMPFRLACHTRTVWQCQHVMALSGLLPPSPALPDSVCPQFLPPCCDIVSDGILPPLLNQQAPHGARVVAHRPFVRLDRWSRQPDQTGGEGRLRYLSSLALPINDAGQAAARPLPSHTRSITLSFALLVVAHIAQESYRGRIGSTAFTRAVIPYLRRVSPRPAREPRAAWDLRAILPLSQGVLDVRSVDHLAVQGLFSNGPPSATIPGATHRAELLQTRYLLAGTEAYGTYYEAPPPRSR
ncbi:hypothetical protein J2S48_001736 [Promicromonospora iranensis]|uniref:Uncharacterized protein n=1 Tax=Promicromonospora iranensis TaxID=1105144 RepID=A0ABU2CLK7_9MICO|nr:hypothetical protein [Promicromonospora iranensis]